MQSRAKRIESALSASLSPTRIEVQDDSGRHAGHMGARAEGETHYNVLVVSAVFIGESRIARHRRINRLLAQEFASGLHALSLTLLTPDEASSRGKPRPEGA